MRISDWSSDVCSSDLEQIVMIGLRPREEEVRLVLVFGLGSPGILDAECGKHCFEVILERLTSASLSPVLNTKRETQKPVDVRAPGGEKAARNQLRNDMSLKPAEEKLLALHRSEAHTSELQSLMRTSYAVFCLQKQKNSTQQ